MDKETKTILKDFYMNGYTNKCLIDCHMNMNDTNIQSFIHEYLIDTFGIEEYKRHKDNINYYYPNSINENNLNLDLISAIFLLKEILSETSTDLIYSYEMELRGRNRYMLTYQEEYIKTRLRHIESIDIKLFICMELIKERFKQIKMTIHNNEIIPAQRHIFKAENTFPVFIVIKEKNGNEALYQCHKSNTY